METANNAAYDLTMYNNRSTEEVNEDIKVRTLRVIKNKRRVKAIAPYKIILVIMASLVVITLMIYSRVMLMELNAEINSYQEQMTVLQSEHVRLSAELEASTSMKNLEASAVDELGLTKIDSSQVEYVNLAGDDKIQVAKVSGSFTVAKWWEDFISTAKEYIGF